MTTITHLWTCTCGTESECRAEDLRYGAVYQCPGCRQVFGCLYPRDGGKAWVRISEADVRFHHLLQEPTGD